MEIYTKQKRQNTICPYKYRDVARFRSPCQTEFNMLLGELRLKVRELDEVTDISK